MRKTVWLGPSAAQNYQLLYVTAWTAEYVGCVFLMQANRCVSNE
jgi:low affinity Fe/Cu permease